MGRLRWAICISVVLAVCNVSPAQVPNAQSDGARALYGEWYSQTYQYGFRIEGNIGIATAANGGMFKPGDVILKMQRTSPTSFVGQQKYANGGWQPINGALLPDGTLRIQNQRNQVWSMVRIASQKSAAGTSAPGNTQNQRPPPLPEEMGTSAANARDPNTWVLTTRGFGPITLGMMPGDAKRASGGRLVKDGSDGGSDEYDFKGLGPGARLFTCVADGTGRPQPLGEIRLFAAPATRFVTDKGIKARDPASSVVQAYGRNLRKERDDYATLYTYIDPQNPSFSISFTVPHSGELQGRVSMISAKWKDPKRCSD